MDNHKNILKTQAIRLLAGIMLSALLAGTLTVPAQAALLPAGSDPAASSLIEEKSQSPAASAAVAVKWVTVGNHLRLKSSDGKYLTGFVKYNGKYYYFNSKGNLKTGFFTVNGKTRYASYITGAKGKGQILTGLVWVSGHIYLMDPASTPAPGAILTGFRKYLGRRYYFNSKGHMVNGWFTVGGNKYYASCNKKKHYGALLTGIQKIGSKTYQFDSTGKLLRTVSGTTGNNSRSLADFKVIGQHPQLPTGCEVTSLTMVLNYYGFSADKLDLADNYLPKGPVGSTDFRKAFVGNPRNGWSYGCYAPVIVKTANSYLKSKNSRRKAYDISGKELPALSVYTKANIPVMVWTTINCLEPYYSVTWTVNSRKLTWVSQEHCVVLLGFTNGKVRVADPHSGSFRLYDLSLFRRRYNSLFKQAVFIK